LPSQPQNRGAPASLVARAVPHARRVVHACGGETLPLQTTAAVAQMKVNL